MLTGLEQLSIDLLPPISYDQMAIERALAAQGRRTNLTILHLFSPVDFLSPCSHLELYATVIENLPHLTTLSLQSFESLPDPILDALVSLENLTSLAFIESTIPSSFAQAPWTAPLTHLSIDYSDHHLDMPSFVDFLESFQSTLLCLAFSIEGQDDWFNLAPIDWAEEHPDLEIDLPELVLLILGARTIHPSILCAFNGSPLRELHLIGTEFTREELALVLETFEETLESVGFTRRIIWRSGEGGGSEEEIKKVRDEVAPDVSLFLVGGR